MLGIQKQILEYIETKLNLSEYKIVDEEKGALPMYDIENKSSENYINIGSRGGATKISTGYAFSFFLKNIMLNFENINKYLNNLLENKKEIIDHEIFLFFIKKLNRYSIFYYL